MSEAGVCGDKAPALREQPALGICVLPAGHAGWHRNDEAPPMHWNTPVADDVEAAEREARVRAFFDSVPEPEGTIDEILEADRARWPHA